MFDDDDFIQDDQEFRDNWGDWERVGIGIDHPLLINQRLAAMKDMNNIGKMQQRFFKINASDDEKFAHILEAVYYTYSDILEPSLQRDDLRNMLDAIYSFKNIYFKNPTCYLFGYYIVDQNTSTIDKSKLANVLELDVIKRAKLFSNIDIIRYCRLWIGKYKLE
jgi:hypothetical protein